MGWLHLLDDDDHVLYVSFTVHVFSFCVAMSTWLCLSTCPYVFNAQLGHRLAAHIYPIGPDFDASGYLLDFVFKASVEPKPVAAAAF